MPLSLLDADCLVAVRDPMGWRGEFEYGGVLCCWTTRQSQGWRGVGGGGFGDMRGVGWGMGGQ